MSMSRPLNYIAECARLLYWIYFKPYTLKQWLQDIHPDLKPNDNPYLKLRQFPSNKRLRRYAGQVFWLTVITPQIAILVVGLIYTALTQESFNWFESEIFLAAWIIGQIISRFGCVFFGEKFHLIFLVIFIIFIVANQFLDGVTTEVIIVVVIGIISSASFIAVLNLVTSMAIIAITVVVIGVVPNVFSNVVISVMLGVAISMLLNVILSIEFGVAFVAKVSVSLGIVFGVIYTTTVGLAFGIVFTSAFLFVPLRVYFWLPELLWVGLLFFSTSQGRFAARLRYLPPYFDQVIHLPLPFMSTMLLEAYREKPNAARKTITYLTQSTNQQKIAARAIVNIVLDTLEHCRTLLDIIAITEELAWIPTPAPPEIGRIPSDFLKISLGVQSANEATSVYRKVESLKQPIKDLIQKQQSFAFNKNPRIATAASNIAQKWLSILETARRNLEKQSDYAKEIPQVYIAGGSLDPQTAQNRFKGRQDLFREIENIALRSPPPTLLLYGGRRTGKTSTLKYLPKKVGGDLIPLIVDFQGIASAGTLSGVAKSLVGQMIDSARISRNLTLRPPDREELRTDPFLTLQDWFTEIERTAPRKRFLLCLDEFERLEEVIAATNSRVPLNFLRHVIQHRSAWTLLFSGSHTLDEMENYWSDYLISTRYVRLTYLEKPEAKELIKHPVPDFPDIYLPEAVERIIYWTRCQPYLVQLLCSELVYYLNRQYPQNNLQVKATSADVESIISKALVTGSIYFNEFWDITLNSEERESIRNLIKAVPPTAKDRKIRRKLIKKEILEPDGKEGVRFQVPLIRRSIIQKIKEEL